MWLECEIFGRRITIKCIIPIVNEVHGDGECTFMSTMRKVDVLNFALAIAISRRECHPFFISLLPKVTASSSTHAVSGHIEVGQAHHYFYPCYVVDNLSANPNEEEILNDRGVHRLPDWDHESSILLTEIKAGSRFNLFGVWLSLPFLKLEATRIFAVGSLGRTLSTFIWLIFDNIREKTKKESIG